MNIFQTLKSLKQAAKEKIAALFFDTYLLFGRGAYLNY